MTISARLVFTADDFGLTEGVSAGIAQTLKVGVITSTSVLVCRNNAKLIKRWSNELSGYAGLHLQLSDGLPCLPPDQIPSLVSESGVFPERRASLRRLDPGEILAEWIAQFQRLLQLGIQPTHLNSHHNVHTMPQVLPVYAQLALRLGLPARSGDPSITKYLRDRGVTCPDICVDHWFYPQVDHARLLAVVRKYLNLFPGGVIEFMCHAGYVDDDLREVSHYVEARQDEMNLFCLPELRSQLIELGIQLAPMAKLTKNSGSIASGDVSD